MNASLDQLRQQCATRAAAGADLLELRDELRYQGIDESSVDLVLSELAPPEHPIQRAMQERTLWSEMASEGRQQLTAGKTLVDVYLHVLAKCQNFYPDPTRALHAARTATESIGSVFSRHAISPLANDAFLTAFRADIDLLLTGPPAGATSPIYPEQIPAQFFHNPERFLDMCERLGSRCLEVLWSTTEGCDGLLASGMAHCGRLKDSRRYLILRMPPPQLRFEAHYLAFVGEGEGSPARLFAMERGVTTEEAVVCEHYPDGRLRLGAAGPAESKNFIRLVRQQLGL